MSGRKPKDYKEVFLKIRELIDNVAPVDVVLDYEKAVWKAAPEVFPDVEIKGCAFHANIYKIYIIYTRYNVKFKKHQSLSVYCW